MKYFANVGIEITLEISLQPCSRGCTLFMDARWKYKQNAPATHTNGAEQVTLWQPPVLRLRF
jgi:hypothetical protein